MGRLIVPSMGPVNPETLEYFKQEVIKYMTANFESMYGKPFTSCFKIFAEDYRKHKRDKPLFIQYEEPLKNFIQKERNKAWFKNLYKRKSEMAVASREERNSKIRKIEKVPDMEFVTDSNLLIHMFEYLPLENMLIVRNSCLYFQQFFEQHFFKICKHCHLPSHFYFVCNEISDEKMGVNAKSIYRLWRPYKCICILSGVEKATVDSLVAEYVSKGLTRPSREFFTKQIIALFEATNHHFNQVIKFTIEEHDNPYNFKRTTCPLSYSKIQIDRMILCQYGPMVVKLFHYPSNLILCLEPTPTDCLYETLNMIQMDDRPQQYEKFVILYHMRREISISFGLNLEDPRLKTFNIPSGVTLVVLTDMEMVVFEKTKRYEYDRKHCFLDLWIDFLQQDQKVEHYICKHQSEESMQVLQRVLHFVATKCKRNFTIL